MNDKETHLPFVPGPPEQPGYCYHPSEWIGPDGKCSECEEEKRVAELEAEVGRLLEVERKLRAVIACREEDEADYQERLEAAEAERDEARSLLRRAKRCCNDGAWRWIVLDGKDDPAWLKEPPAGAGG